MLSNRREFLFYSTLAMSSLVPGLQSTLTAQSIPNLDTSELPGMAALRWYARQLTLVNPKDLEFKVLEREAKESGTVPFKVNGAYVYKKGGPYLNIQRPDLGHKFNMRYSDLNHTAKYVNDFWLKGYLGDNADVACVSTEIGNSTERSWWYGYGGYRLIRFRPAGKNEESSPTQFEINGKPHYIGGNKVLEGVADYDTTMAPLLTGPHEGKHAELMRRRNQVFRETNTEYRKNLQHIIKGLEKEGKIKL